MALKFRRVQIDEPEINLIPFIDVLLVVLIFLMLTTTYSKFTELKVSLPTADAEKAQDQPSELVVAVSADGKYAINGQAVGGRSVEVLAAALKAGAATLKAPVGGPTAPIVIISADATAAHQSVINVLDAARHAGLVKLTFATLKPTP
jgi:biopolymer transport protein ExbD